MSSERLIAAFDDIARAIDLVDAWVKEAGGSAKALRANTQSRSAIERRLLIISEAAIRRHKIDLDGAIIAGVVDEKLAELRRACFSAIESLQGSE